MLILERFHDIKYFISLHCSLKKVFLSLLATLWKSAFKQVYHSFSPLLFTSLLFSAICKASLDSHFAYLHFFFGEDGLAPCLLYNVTNLCPQFFRHSVSQIQSLKSISHFRCITVRDLIQVIPEWSSGFLYFLQFKSEFGNKEFMISGTVSSRSCFC